MVKLHVFDMDGTLLDSMPMWDNLLNDFLMTRGIEPDGNLVEITDKLTFVDAINYMSDTYDLGSVDETMAKIEEYIVGRYRDDLELFPGVTEYLEEISQKGVPMVILTNSWRRLADLALTRTGIIGYFDAIHTYENLGVTKNDPASFTKVCELHGTLPAEALVHDDSDYAVAAALKAGCKVKTYDRYR